MVRLDSRLYDLLSMLNRCTPSAKIVVTSILDVQFGIERFVTIQFKQLNYG